MRLLQSNRWPDLLLASLFCLVIATPALVMLLQIEPTVSWKERRRLAPKPKIEMETIVSAEYQEGYGSYFNDHFGFRSEILSAAAMFRSTVFAKSISSKAIVGSDGWLYFNIDGSLHDFVGMYSLTDDQLAWLKDGLNTKQRWLESLGVRYLLVPIPGKMSVYPTNLPRQVVKVAGITRLQGFMKAIQGQPESDFVVDSMAALLEAKKQGRVYFQTDTHWNDDGAYAVYAATMTKLSAWFPELTPIEKSRFSRVARHKIGDTALAAGLFREPGESGENLELSDSCARDRYAEVMSFKYTDAFQSRPKAVPVASGCSAKKLKALVVHDSFGAYLKKYLNEHFSEIVYMASYDVFGMKSFIESFQPDVYIDFRADRRFHLLLAPDPRMAAELNGG